MPELDGALGCSRERNGGHPVRAAIEALVPRPGQGEEVDGEGKKTQEQQHHDCERCLRNVEGEGGSAT